MLGPLCPLAPLSPEVTGPGLSRGARVTGSPRGRGPPAARVPPPGAGPPAPRPVLGQQPRPLLPRRVKRKQGGGGPSQLRPGDSALTRGPRQTEARATGSGGRAMSFQAAMRVHPSPAQHSTERRGQLSRTRSSGLAAPPGLPPAPALCCQAGCLRPSVHSSGDSQTHRLTASPSRPRPPPWPSACGKHPPCPLWARGQTLGRQGGLRPGARPRGLSAAVPAPGSFLRGRWPGAGVCYLISILAPFYQVSGLLGRNALLFPTLPDTF